MCYAVADFGAFEVEGFEGEVFKGFGEAGGVYGGGF